ncbi:hypothetical protein [Nocardioides donggukensis]|nr:hypothetical protein [Nocardioides donggukensis]
MRSITTKFIAAAAVAVIASLGVAAPAEAGGKQESRTIWCC